MIARDIHIEKYDIDSFEKEQKPYCMVLTDVIQRIPPERMREAFLWVYLESLPSTWKPNKSHLTKHFNISDRTYDRWMSWLNAVNLIEYRQQRETGGAFGKGTLVVLNGSKFTPDAESTGLVNIDNQLINKKKQKVIHNSLPTEPPNLAIPGKPPKPRVDTGLTDDSPNRQFAEVRLNGAYINTTKRITKEKEKTNNTVSVFFDIYSVRTQIEKTIAKRCTFVEDDIIDQIAYYSFIQNKEKDYDSIIKRINIGLKKVRENCWNIPQGYKGVTSQSIREKEDEYEENKKEQYKQEAVMYNAIVQTQTTGKGFAEFSELVKSLRTA